ncbi:NOL1/NOP2/Sun domain member 3 [Branchiostoma belcheri]|nr:NOL1/NOP2/Sun domain member 3 [Branchiostoma belcheri]
MALETTFRVRKYRKSLATANHPSRTEENDSNPKAISLGDVYANNTVEERREFKHSRTPSQLILDHFDRQYGQQFGSDWGDIRAALMAPKLNGLLLNNFAQVSTKLKHVPGQLKSYFLQGASSLLPVLALNVQQDDSVLDMCAAPGGKSLALLQAAKLGLLTSNEPDLWRRRRLAETLQSYIPQEILQTRVDVTKLNGVHFQDVTPNTFDKVLVDAPCSNDRSWLYSKNSVGMQMRIEDRRHLPQLQASLLSSALHAVKPGGSVVYATCTLSQKENDDVVEFCLRQNKSRIDVINLHNFSKNFQKFFRFDSSTRYGQLVLPHVDANWGPMYLAKLKKIDT